MQIYKTQPILAIVILCVVGGILIFPTSAGEIFDPKPAPPFKAKTLDEQEIDLKKFHGKLVLLEFWRRDCSDCVLTMEKLIDLRKQVPEEQLVMIGINCDEDVTLARNFLRRKPTEWPQIHAHSQDVGLSDLYKVENLPAFCLIDGEGNLIYRGERAKVEDLEDIISPRLSDTSGADSK